ncbi:hypothetical protein BDV34DRAFT_235393 [Aspergillus parasiticus]|uniref:Uncharacterized protein n=1 Tax=Aspergillus parasiticus TaxID=5067 RepID=A0A5N6DIY0_ASPPA|nr:hypothetical protein BDV34DRAFT_235393 [Aspergillus parasiticus]
MSVQREMGYWVNSDVTREGGTGTCPDVADLGYADVPIVEAWAELPVWPRCVSSSGDALDRFAVSSGCGRR